MMGVGEEDDGSSSLWRWRSGDHETILLQIAGTCQGWWDPQDRPARRGRGCGPPRAHPDDPRPVAKATKACKEKLSESLVLGGTPGKGQGEIVACRASWRGFFPASGVERAGR